MNIKHSFTKNDMANFDYALTLTKYLGYKLFNICYRNDTKSSKQTYEHHNTSPIDSYNLK